MARRAEGRSRAQIGFPPAGSVLRTRCRWGLATGRSVSCGNRRDDAGCAMRMSARLSGAGVAWGLARVRDGHTVAVHLSGSGWSVCSSVGVDGTVGLNCGVRNRRRDMNKGRTYQSGQNNERILEWEGGMSRLEIL